MEDNVLEQGLSSQDLNHKLSNENLAYLKSAGSWTKFLGILSFIGAGLMVLGGLMMTFLFSALPNMNLPDTPNSAQLKNFSLIGPGLGIMYLLLSLPIFLLGRYLNGFSNKIDNVWRNNSAHDLTLAFRNLRNYFRMRGWLIIGGVILYFVFIFAFLGMMGSGMMGRY